jgi:hypothetical protein
MRDYANLETKLQSNWFCSIMRSIGLILFTVLPGLLRDLAGLSGVGLVSYGAWLVYPPAGFIVGGTLMCTAPGYLDTR